MGGERSVKVDLCQGQLVNSEVQITDYIIKRPLANQMTEMSLIYPINQSASALNEDQH